MKNSIFCAVMCCATLTACIRTAGATETENLGIRVLPAPGKVVVDGKTDDWDLSAGVFTCGDVENHATPWRRGSTPCTMRTISTSLRDSTTTRP